MALAEKGDNLKLDKTIQDVGDEGEANVDKKDDGEDRSMYGKFLDSEIAPMPVFLFCSGGGILSFKECFQ